MSDDGQRDVKLPDPELDPSVADSSWAVAGRAETLLCGPMRSVRNITPRRAVVTLLPPGTDLEAGEEIHRIHVRESGLREYGVTWHDSPYDGVTVADNPAGRNRVAWSDDRTRWWLTNVDGGHVAAVHVRFVLRHLTTLALLEDTDGRELHAVTLRTAGDGVVAIVGATTSGKTRLANRLVADQVAGPFVDDDCPVLAPTGDAWSLVPARHEVVRARKGPVRGFVLLRRTRGDTLTPTSFLDDAPAAWPAAWLPSPPTPTATLPASAAGVPVLEVDERIDGDEVAVRRVSVFVRELPV